MENIKIKKWGYKNQPFEVKELSIDIRSDTTDIKIVDEVLTRNVYQKKKIGFEIEKDDVWLDLGSNIGAFSLFALSSGGDVICVEPEPENISLTEQNIKNNFNDENRYKIIPKAIDIKKGTVDLYLCKGDYNKSRHTVFKKRGRSSIKVDTITLPEILEEYPSINAIKIDIEGSEIELLENIDFEKYPNIRKLVYEYTFDIDPSIPRFMNIIYRLEKVFDTVHYTKVKPNDLVYKYYPLCTNVYCIKK